MTVPELIHPLPPEGGFDKSLRKPPGIYFAADLGIQTESAAYVLF